MAGNSRRRGATRSPGSKKGATTGTGGHRRRALEGRGPTPKATERTGHPAARRAAATRSAQRGDGPSGHAPGGARGARPKPGSEVVAGRNPVVEALQARIPAGALYVLTRIESDDRVRQALRAAADRGIPVLEATRPELDRLAAGALHQGLLLQVPPYAYAHPDDLLETAAEAGAAPLLVALDGVTDPRNLGAVVRSVAAFAGHGVLIPKRRSAGMGAGAWKASAGAATRVRVAQVPNLTQALERLRGQGCLLVGLDAAAGAALPDVPALDEPLVLVIGSEGRGLSRLVRQTCDVLAAIPMAAGTESLNAGVAAGIALYEAARRRSAW